MDELSTYIWKRWNSIGLKICAYTIRTSFRKLWQQQLMVVGRGLWYLQVSHIGRNSRWPESILWHLFRTIRSLKASRRNTEVLSHCIFSLWKVSISAFCDYNIYGWDGSVWCFPQISGWRLQPRELLHHLNFALCMNELSDILVASKLEVFAIVNKAAIHISMQVFVCTWIFNSFW